MTAADRRPGPGPSSSRPSVDAGRLWAGGAATACVAALVGFVGVLLVDGVFDVALLAPSWLLGDEADVAAAVRFAVTGGVAALAATGLLHALVEVTPRPQAFFAWIVSLTTVAAIAVVLALDTALSARIATACITAAIGLAIGSLLTGVAARTTTALG